MGLLKGELAGGQVPIIGADSAENAHLRRCALGEQHRRDREKEKKT